MTRWADDPERAADDLIRRSSMPSTSAGASCSPTRAERCLHCLLSADLPLSLEPAPRWRRQSRALAAAGPFDVALLRLPKAKDEQEMAVHACLSVLSSDGR
jgi:hypothetical protein